MTIMKKLIALLLLGAFIAVPATQAGCCGDKMSAKKTKSAGCPAMSCSGASKTTAKVQSDRPAKVLSGKRLQKPSLKGAEVLAKL